MKPYTRRQWQQAGNTQILVTIAALLYADDRTVAVVAAVFAVYAAVRSLGAPE